MSLNNTIKFLKKKIMELKYIMMDPVLNQLIILLLPIISF
jgi:hypothetical protein